MADSNCALHATHRVFPSPLAFLRALTGCRRSAEALTRFERLGLADIIYQKSVRGLAGSAVSASGGIPHPRRPPFDQKRAFFFHHGILSPLKLEKGKALAIH
jgi:hypothetical protein